MIRCIFFILLIFISCLSLPQGAGSLLTQLEGRVDANPDSVRIILSKNISSLKDPRKKIGTHHLLGVAYKNLGNYDSAIYHFNREDSLLQNYTPNVETAVANQTALADIYYQSGNLIQAEKYYQSALGIARKSNDYAIMCKALLSCGWISREQGRHALALDYYFEAIHLAEANQDETLLGSAYGKIAIVYNVKGELDKARQYYYKALEIHLRNANMAAVGSTYNNIGLMHDYAKDYDSAIWFFEKSMHIADSLDDERGVAIANENIGLMYYQKNQDLDIGLQKLKVSLDTWRKFDDIFGQSQTLIYMVFIYNAQKKYEVALDSAFRSLDLARQAGANDVQQQALEQIYLAYEGIGDYAMSLQYYMEFDQLRDSLSALNSMAEIDKLGLEYEYESKQLEDSLSLALRHEQEQAEIMLDVETGKFWNKLLLIGLIAFLLVIVLIYYLAKQQKRNSKLVSRTNLMLLAKNKEIIDSINYAKRIQNAILPTPSRIRAIFENSFVFYRPKDIVAGDFYWLSEIESGGQKIVYFAVADCTGHGVPGAMVSVICSSALNKVINELGVKDPGDILSKVTDLVIETFEQSDNELKDGMDIALCSFNQTSGELHFSGANNGIWIVSDRAYLYDKAHILTSPESPFFLHEIKATKQPVGRYSKRIPFETHSLLLKANEQIYLFTDGFADQFGGLRNKKFKYSSLKKLLLSVAGYGVDDQREALRKNFEDWRGSMEQVDDVCVIGVRL